MCSMYYNNNLYCNFVRNTYYDKYWSFKIRLETAKITRKFILILFLINNRYDKFLPEEMVFHILTFFQLKNLKKLN